MKKLITKYLGDKFAFSIEVLIVSVFILIYALPIGWLAITAFKPAQKAYTLSLQFKPTLENFKVLFTTQGTHDFLPYLFNSIVVTAFSLFIAIPASILEAYALSRFDFKWGKQLLLGTIATQFLPAVIVALPFFSLYYKLNLLDTRIGLIIINLGFLLPFGVWLSKGFIDDIPEALEEAALIDGCNRLQVIWRIILPLAKPGIISTTAYTFVLSWNSFLFPLILTNERAVTMPVALMFLRGQRGVHWETMAAAGLVLIIPPVLFMLYSRKHFEKGLTMGAID